MFDTTVIINPDGERQRVLISEAIRILDEKEGVCNGRTIQNKRKYEQA
jgi:hypothetical protein